MKDIFKTAGKIIGGIIPQHRNIHMHTSMSNAVAVLGIGLILLIACGSVSIAQTPESPAYWPTEGWQTSTPEEQGMDSERLADALDYLQEHRAEFHLQSLLIIRHGDIVTDAYFDPFAPGMLHDLTSVTKSFTATLTGIAIDKGYIESVEQPVLDIFPERTVTNVDANKEAMTVEDLLTMRSGFGCLSEGNTVGGGLRRR